MGCTRIKNKYLLIQLISAAPIISFVIYVHIYNTVLRKREK